MTKDSSVNWQAVLERDCNPHYFKDEINAFQYVWEGYCDEVEKKEDCDPKEIIDAYKSLAVADLGGEHYINGVGYYFRVYAEDVAE